MLLSPFSHVSLTSKLMKAFLNKQQHLVIFRDNILLLESKDEKQL